LTIKTEKDVKNIERTPCMAEGITDQKAKDINDLYLFKLLGCNECLGRGS
jgi:hypothetical protein